MNEFLSDEEVLDEFLSNYFLLNESKYDLGLTKWLIHQKETEKERMVRRHVEKFSHKDESKLIERRNRHLVYATSQKNTMNNYKDHIKDVYFEDATKAAKIFGKSSDKAFLYQKSLDTNRGPDTSRLPKKFYSDLKHRYVTKDHTELNRLYEAAVVKHKEGNKNKKAGLVLGKTSIFVIY